MSYLRERWAIYARFEEQWADRTPISWPGVNFTAPSGASWVRVSVPTGTARQIAFGGTASLYRHDGEVIVEVFSPRGRGEGPTLELADHAADVFRGWRSAAAGLKFSAVFAADGSVVDGWWKVDVIAPFERDEFFTAST